MVVIQFPALCCPLVQSSTHFFFYFVWCECCMKNSHHSKFVELKFRVGFLVKWKSKTLIKIVNQSVGFPWQSMETLFAAFISTNSIKLMPLQFSLLSDSHYYTRLKFCDFDERYGRHKIFNWDFRPYYIDICDLNYLQIYGGNRSQWLNRWAI